jgi:N-acetylated-alpha-linked acidic dipeptidase
MRPPLAGFSAESARTEREVETKFRALPDRANLRQYMQRLSARPHHVGSPYDKDNAEWMLAKFKEWGWDAKIENYDVLFPTPKERVLELTEPSHFKAKLQEPPVSGDPTSSQQDEQLPSYNAYSIDGDVTAPLVYVNYGAQDDYKELERLGVSVKGAIVIARYGQPGAASSPSWPPSMARWAASFIPIRATTVMPKAKPIPLVRFVPPTACSAEA